MTKKRKPTNEEIGWLWVHGASAGGMSIAAWEMLRHAVQGPVLFLLYGGVTAVSFLTVAIHHNRKTRPRKRAKKELKL